MTSEKVTVGHVGGGVICVELCTSKQSGTVIKVINIQVIFFAYLISIC